MICKDLDTILFETRLVGTFATGMGNPNWDTQVVISGTPTGNFASRHMLKVDRRYPLYGPGNTIASSEYNPKDLADYLEYLADLI